ncbi:MAG TPA: hypothetical protein VIL42_03300 [Sphingomicrobium sp.]|jgi:hypothetical protein
MAIAITDGCEAAAVQPKGSVALVFAFLAMALEHLVGLIKQVLRFLDAVAKSALALLDLMGLALAALFS